MKPIKQPQEAFRGWYRFHDLILGLLCRIPFRDREKTYYNGIAIADISPRASSLDAHFAELIRDALELLVSSGNFEIVQGNVSAIVNQRMRTWVSGVVRYRWCLLDYARIIKGSRADEVVAQCAALIAGRAYYFNLVRTPGYGSLRDVVAATREFQNTVYGTLMEQDLRNRENGRSQSSDAP